MDILATTSSSNISQPFTKSGYFWYGKNQYSILQISIHSDQFGSALTYLEMPFNLHLEKWFWGSHLRFCKVWTWRKYRVVSTLNSIQSYCMYLLSVIVKFKSQFLIICSIEYIVKSKIIFLADLCCLFNSFVFYGQILAPLWPVGQNTLITLCHTYCPNWTYGKCLLYSGSGRGKISCCLLPFLT